MTAPQSKGRAKLTRNFRKHWRTLIVGIAGLLITTGASAVCLGEAPLRGVNLSGAEFNSRELPGEMFRDYTYPSADDYEYFAEKGANLIRLPIRWERIQHSLRGELDGSELAQIRKSVDLARANGQCLLLDLHNYAAWHGEVLGEGRVSTADLIDVWQRLARELDDPDHVALGLMNEPFRMDIADWALSAQQTVTALREQGAEHLIAVSGGRWSGVHEWFKVRTGTSNSAAFVNLDDPLDRIMLEVHQYLNEGYSGTKLDCLPPEHFDSMFQNISNWARENGYQLFLGEFGSPRRQECLASLDRILQLTSDPDIWRGWAYWAAGAWWGDYFLTIHPIHGKDRPQMEVLEPFLASSKCPNGLCPEPPEDLTVEQGRN